MIEGGYILQPRVFDESYSSKMPPVARELWMYLLRKVSHKPYKNLKRGEGFFSLADIQNDMSWYVGYRKMTYSKPQLTKSLRRLREGNMIATTKATRGVLVSICNYEYYQDPKNYEGNDEGSTKKPRRKSSGSTNNKNVKKEEKAYGEFKNVFISEAEMKKLNDKFNGSLSTKIENLSWYMASKGKKYNSHYLTILNWARKEKAEEQIPNPSPSGTCLNCENLQKCPNKTTKSKACERYEGGVAL